MEKLFVSPRAAGLRIAAGVQRPQLVRACAREGKQSTRPIDTHAKAAHLAEGRVIEVRNKQALSTPRHRCRRRPAKRFSFSSPQDIRASAAAQRLCNGIGQCRSAPLIRKIKRPRHDLLARPPFPRHRHLQKTRLTRPYPARRSKMSSSSTVLGPSSYVSTHMSARAQEELSWMRRKTSSANP